MHTVQLSRGPKVNDLENSCRDQRLERLAFVRFYLVILGGKPFNCCVMPLGQIPWGNYFVVVGHFSIQIEDRKDAFGGNLWFSDVS